MGFYFDDKDSIYTNHGETVRGVIKTIAQRYKKQHPSAPYTFRPYSCRGIQRDQEYRYTADFSRLFPDCENGSYLYAWGCYESERPVDYQMDLTPYGPVSIFLNGVLIYETDVFAERYQDRRNPLMLSMNKGTNHLILRFTKTAAGFGGIFGTWMGKLCYYFTMPGSHSYMEGFAYSQPQKEPCRTLEHLENLNEESQPQDYIASTWLPDLNYGKEELQRSNLERIYGLASDKKAVSMTSFYISEDEQSSLALKGECSGPISIYVNNSLLWETSQAASIEIDFDAIIGENRIFCIGSSSEQSWGFSLELYIHDKLLPLRNPWCSHREAALRYPWVYGGPFQKDQTLKPEMFQNPNDLLPLKGQKTYWRLDFPEGWLRQYNENFLFGHWNYPLGVTLYGLLRTALFENDQALKDYISCHLQQSVDTYAYALWDKEQFGGATAVHHLMTSLDSLDDCGSFGSLMLEAAHHGLIEEYQPLAERIADYIENQQRRLADGTFFRKHLMHTFHEDTLWADDLYMSVPFLCRYYRFSGDNRYLDDAARQFLGFRDHLFMSETKVMSHVYDFLRKSANGVPWGRGNGWTLFSLAELLGFLPESHPDRAELVDFFLELSRGYLALQDSSGMWHQVLTEADSYPETSCTAMFIYGFSRGIQMGLYNDESPYRKACEQAWNALCRSSIDKEGNIHGVCRGSEFSFSSDYYKEKLLWRLNDTHGIGIVLLAGVEILALQKRKS